ncbi:MAG: MCE family protein [Bacteroidaceae bacterium]|nr:MCE family protein [Bacteroidaceae bacterium]MBR1541880.1 MCE family protein [Bacteroidaceae bacterium]
MKGFNKEVKIGLAGIVALFLLIFGLNYLKGVSLFKPSNYFYVQFENINGLAKSSPVFADGFKVGIVSDLKYDYTRPGNVVAEIDVEPQLRIPKGTKAELSSDLLGAVKLTLLLANNPREKYNSGDTIQGEVNAGALGKAAAMIPSVEKLIPKLDSIMASLNAILADPAIPATLHNIESLTASLNNNSRQLERMMREDIPQLTGKLNDIGDNFSVISGNLKQIDYAATMSKVDETLANVQQITAKLEKKDNTVGLLLNDPTLYNNLNQTAANAASLLEDLQNHPKRYVHFSVFGKKDKQQNP